jgi:transcriptional regulator with XRE-family HTH domain
MHDMAIDCPFTEEGVLLIRSERRSVTAPFGRRLATVERDVRYITVAKFDELKQSIQEAATGRFCSQGIIYLRPDLALKELRIPRQLRTLDVGRKRVTSPAARNLSEWHTKGCTYLDGEKLGGKPFKFDQHRKGSPEVWYQEDHILQIKTEILKAIQKAKHEGESFGAVLRRLCRRAGLTLSGLSKESGASLCAIHSWQNGQRTPTPRMARKVATALGVSVTDLPLPRHRPKQRRPHWDFDGVFRDEDGKVAGYTLPRAAAKIRIPYSSLVRATLRLAKPFRGLFPKGRLPRTPMLVPGTRKCWRDAITPDDLATFVTETARIIREGERLVHGSISREGICERYGITGRFHWGKVRKLLNALGRRKLLTVTRVPVPNPKRKGAWHTPGYYNPDQIDQLLDGRNLVALALQFHSDPDSVQWPTAGQGEPATATGSDATTKAVKPSRNGRGRPKGKNDPEVAKRDQDIRDDWATGEWTDKTALGRKYGVERWTVHKALKGG